MVAIRVDINALREVFVTLLRDRDREIEGLKAEVSELHKLVAVLDAKLDDAEAHDRRDMLVFSGSDSTHVLTVPYTSSTFSLSTY